MVLYEDKQICYAVLYSSAPISMHYRSSLNKKQSKKKVIEFSIHLHYLIYHIVTVKIKIKEKKIRTSKVYKYMFLNGKIAS